MASVVAREALKHSLRNSTKYVTCLQTGSSVADCGSCPFRDGFVRQVFSCSGLHDRTTQYAQNVLFNRNRQYPSVGVLKACIAEHHNSECITHQECWKCGQAIDPNKEQYFCVCGVVQRPIEKRSLFQVMGVEESFDIDLRQLSHKYHDLQRTLHPDKYLQKSETEIEFSILHSSVVNKAYNTLLKPLTRGLYMLGLDEERLEKETQMDLQSLDFLDRIMEINEVITEAESLEEIEAIAEENQKEIDDLIANISRSFKEKDTVQAKKLLLELKYFASIDERIKDFKIRYMGKCE